MRTDRRSAQIFQKKPRTAPRAAIRPAKTVERTYSKVVIEPPRPRSARGRDVVTPVDVLMGRELQTRSEYMEPTADLALVEELALFEYDSETADDATSVASSNAYSTYTLDDHGNCDDYSSSDDEGYRFDELPGPRLLVTLRRPRETWERKPSNREGRVLTLAEESYIVE